ncbi:unnamed protein product [Phytophthora lilii]|uniref:Unnamed protein product n=1 Tax=Phytophthora lilii TaxID=2077276 RepID=A0A9W6WTQ9_9STRA|nr:unnamed protein product [Phytophthora lilii]
MQSTSDTILDPRGTSQRSGDLLATLDVAYKNENLGEGSDCSVNSRGGSGYDGGCTNGAELEADGTVDYEDESVEVHTFSASALSFVKWRQSGSETPGQIDYAIYKDVHEPRDQWRLVDAFSLRKSNRIRNQARANSNRLLPTLASAPIRRVRPLHHKEHTQVIERQQKALGPEGLEECVCIVGSTCSR